MSYDDVSTSTRITLAQSKRRRRRRGIFRAKVIAGAFGVAFLLGFIGGCSAPGA